jgi:hypothetical protein
MIPALLPLAFELRDFQFHETLGVLRCAPAGDVLPGILALGRVRVRF